MPLSKARDKLRQRIRRGTVLPSPTDEFLLLPQYKRKEVLAEIALHKSETPVTPGHRIAAIKEINLMEHIYDSYPAGSGNRTYNIIIQGNKEEELKLMNQLLQGKVPELETTHFEGKNIHST